MSSDDRDESSSWARSEAESDVRIGRGDAMAIAADGGSDGGGVGKRVGLRQRQAESSVSQRPRRLLVAAVGLQIERDDILGE